MAAPLRVVFCGTPEFAVPCFHACRADGIEPVAVYTQPDRHAGRGRKLTASPVKQAAQTAGVPVEQPSSLQSTEVQARLAACRPDLLVVVAYGLLLPQAVLDLPRLGCWNVHASLLPRWRGAAPIQRAIAAGDRQTGVCLMRMEAGLDTGPVLLQRTTPIDDEDTGGSLHDRLAQLGAEVLGDGLQRLMANSLPEPVAQADTGTCYARKLNKAEGTLEADRPAAELERIIRAFDPWPGATLELAGERVRIWHARAHTLAEPTPPGTIVAASRTGIDLACAPGVLRIHALQRPGGRLIHAADYLNARPQLRAAV